MTSRDTPRRGVFISFEGIDGTGKSTQAALLARWLEEQDFDVVQTREPGGTPLGAELRRLLLGMKRARPEPPAESDELSGSEGGEGAAGGDDGAAVGFGGTDGDVRAPAPVAEMLLMAADRAQHVARVIEPALAAGKVVVTDRFVDSSLAYQGAGLGLPEDDVRRVNEVATGGLLPDLTILLDLDPSRAYERGEAVRDRIERRGPAFQERVRAAYHELARRQPERWLTVNVEGMSIEAVHEAVKRGVTALLKERGM